MIAAAAPLRGHNLTCTNNPKVTNYRCRIMSAVTHRRRPRLTTMAIRRKGIITIPEAIREQLGTLFKTLEKCDGTGSRVATIGNGSPERIESSVEGILVSRRTVALPSYYRPDVVADAGTRVPGPGGAY